METPFLTQWLSEQVVKAICWTLIHSLWTGLLAAGLAGLVITGTRRSPARLRYQLLCGTLLAFVLISGFIFYRELSSQPQTQLIGSPSAIVPMVSKPVLLPTNSPIAESHSIADHAISFVNQESGWIFTIWLLFFLFKSLKLIGGLFQVYRIRHYKVHPLSNEWNRKVIAFGKTLGIRRSITFLQSELINVPVTVGHFKPVILLPMGLIFQLPPEQIETILWHELAHIWRRDYLMNLLQSLVEILFFFNPALLWLSALIREEREICCDDIVLAHTTRKSHYLEALLSFQTCTGQPAGSAMALGLGDHQLLNRLKRMVTQENKRLSILEKVALLAGLVLISAFSFIPQTRSERRVNAVILSKNSKPFVRDNRAEVPAHKPKNIQSKKANVSDQKDPIDRLLPTPALKTATLNDTLLKFTSIIFANNNLDMANREMFVKDEQGNKYHLKIDENELVELEVNGIAIAQNELEAHKGLLRQIDRALDEKRHMKAETIREFKAKADGERSQQLERFKEQQLMKESRKQAGKTTEKPSTKWLAKTIEQQSQPSTEPSLTGFKKKYGSGMGADTATKIRTWNSKKLPRLPDISNDQQRVRGIISTLVDEKVVVNSSDVDWFGISTEELIVNGIKQSEELHQKLKTQYGIRAQYGLYYGPVKMTGTGVFMDKENL